jgi:hypothetical protein
VDIRPPNQEAARNGADKTHPIARNALDAEVGTVTVTVAIFERRTWNFAFLFVP